MDDAHMVVLGLPLHLEDVSSLPMSSSPPGNLLHLQYEEAVQQIESDLLRALDAAEGYELLAACELPEDLVDVCLAVSRPECRDDTWDAIMYKRISSSWQHRRPELIWLDDKLEQVHKVAELLGHTLHLPVLAHAAAGHQEQEEALKAAFVERAERGEALVVKPRHGANSCFVSLWPQPQDTDRAQLLRSLEDALRAEDRSWEKECWQLSQVPRGAILQPLYSILVPKREEQGGPRGRDAPMELKVQVLFGCVVGATLNTHPAPLWVLSSGAIQFWDFQDLVARGQVRCKSLDRCYGRHPSTKLLNKLQEVLRSSWPFIRDASERICQTAGLDELRVDWLLGDDTWGPRVGELTYMGAGSRITPPLSMRLARTWAAAHLRRLGRLRLQRSGGGTCELLWPRTAERGKKVAEKS